MSGMSEMSMSGDWTMSMMWMRMPGQSWPGTAASFLGMWIVMMVAMMLPSLVPMLWRYRQAVERASGAHSEWLITLVGTGYFFVWTAVGVAAFAIGAAFSSVVIREPALARMMPGASAGVVLIAGVLQFTRWKARRIACWSDMAPHGRATATDAGMAWRYGLRLGLECVHSCANLMAISLVMGMTDLRVMAAVAAAIIAERFAPRHTRVTHVIGVAVIAMALVLALRAAASSVEVQTNATRATRARDRNALARRA